MSRRFERVVQHKRDIEEQLETTTCDLERHKETVDYLKKQVRMYFFCVVFISYY